MKVFLFFLVFFLNMSDSFSQKEGNVWIFGLNAGLDFNSGLPVSIAGSKIYTIEGSASISNASGQLLFYSDGLKVWDRNHRVMPNGTNLGGNESSTQSAVIVPKPGSANMYYLFTVDASTGPKGLRYNEVNMNLNSGLGDVTAMKNVQLVTPTCEKIGAVRNTADNSYWIITHAFGNNAFVAYKIDRNGVNPVPVISYSGSTITYGGLYDIYKSQGYLKFSPDAKKLACVNSYTNVELFDFDIATGMVSNPKTVNIATDFRHCYGAAFSPSGNLLYLSSSFSSYGRPARIYQYDLLSNDIQASEILINNNPTYGAGALQMGPDCKIYFANDISFGGNTALSFINNPDVPGIGCEFQAGTVQLSGRCKSGLPQFIESFHCSQRYINHTDSCQGSAIDFNLTGNNNDITSSLWDFGDGNRSTAIRPTNSYNRPGNYTVTGNFTTAAGPFTVTTQVTIAPGPVAHQIDDIAVCGNAPFSFDLEKLNSAIRGNQSDAVYGLSYFSAMDDALAHRNLLPALQQLPAGITKIYAKIYNLSNFDCHSIISFNVGVFENPVLYPVSEFALCGESDSNSETTFFDLSIKTSEILNGQPENVFTVKYYLKLTDAQNDINPAATPISNTSNPQEVFFNIVNSNSRPCFQTGSFWLAVKKTPNYEILPVYAICEGSNDPVIVTVPNEFDEYSWSTGETANEISIARTGFYTVTASNIYGTLRCSETKNFEVRLANRAVIKKITVLDWTAEANSINVEVSGKGDYEYSLNGIHYQDETLFTALRSGHYTVYVRDKYGCGITSEEVWILMYPKIFTPNADGYNDCWKIKFSETEPGLTVKIFDRYGKLLKSLAGNSCWDGKFNGNALAADDYWFIISMKNGQELRGHFTLKR